MNNLHPIAQAVQSQGRGKDTQLVHMTPNEVQGLHALAKAHGGSLSVNPATGLVEAGFLDSMLPMIAGAGLMMIPGMQPMGAAMITGLGATMLNGGDLGKGLMAGLGAYGGAGLAGSLGVGAATTGSGITAAAPATINPATASYNAGVNAAGSGAVLPAGGFNFGPNAASSLNGGLTAGAQQSLNYGSLSTAPAATGASSAYSIAPTTAMPTVSALPASATGASQYSLSNTPSIMDKLSSGSFYGDNAMNIGAAAAPMLFQEPDTKTAPVDNEQYQYTYNPGRASQEDLDAQRLANPGGELRHFQPRFSDRRIVRVAQGGLLGLAEGGATGTPYGAVNPIFGQSALGSDTGIADGGNEFKYTYDPVTKTYKKVIPEGTAVAAPPPAQVPQESGGSDFGGGVSGGGGGFAETGESVSGSADAAAAAGVASGNGSAGGGIDSMAQGGLMGLAAGGTASPENQDAPRNANQPMLDLLNKKFGSSSDNLKAFVQASGSNDPNIRANAGAALMGMPMPTQAAVVDPQMETAYNPESQTYYQRPQAATVAPQMVAPYEPDELMYYEKERGAASGGIMGLAAGGMAKGGFVVPADVVSALGNGSTDAGLRALKVKLGAIKHIKGKGDGLSDSIPTSIDGKQPARVADGEAYIDPRTVASIGKGDPKKGAQKLYAMMDKIRKQAHGKTTQQRKVNAKVV